MIDNEAFERFAWMPKLDGLLLQSVGQEMATRLERSFEECSSQTGKTYDQ